MVLPDTAIIQEAPQGRQFEVRLADVPEFVTFLGLGEESFVTGVIAREEFSACCNSVELNLINQALNKGVNLLIALPGQRDDCFLDTDGSD